MDRRIYTTTNNNNPIIHEQEDPDEPYHENGPDSPSSGEDYYYTKITTTAPSPKKSRRCIEKRVVSVPIAAEVEGSKSKGEAYPPSDSWAWRKYGQKPIKGSPYPRGYYRCSSSKGCPGRKQVERSRVDPTTLIITYACDHNHPSPTTKSNQSTTAITAGATATTVVATKNAGKEELRGVFATRPDLELGQVDSPMLDDFGWFDEVAPNNPVFDSPICAGSSCAVADVATVFSIREEDESLFADLGDLPDYSVVFRRSVVEPEEQSRSCSLSAVPCCASSG